MFICSVCLGTLLVKAHMPIPYLLGGMLTALTCKSCLPKANVNWPKPWRELALTVAGYGIGSNFSPAAWSNMLQEVWGIVAATVSILVASLLMAYLSHKSSGEDFKSCVFGMLPGGMTLAMLMAEEDKRTNPNVIVVMQVIRLFCVLMCVPLMVVYLLGAQVTGNGVSAPFRDGIHWLVFIPIGILGGFIGKKIHLSTPMLLGPVILAAVFAVITGGLQPVPFWIMAPAQISIGLYMGMQLDIYKIKQTKKMLPLVLIGTAFLLIVSVGMAYFLSHCYGFSLITAFLAMAPGGIAEMCLAGLSMNENVSIILTYQLMRVFAINMLVPPFTAWMFKKIGRA